MAVRVRTNGEHDSCDPVGDRGDGAQRHLVVKLLAVNLEDVGRQGALGNQLQKKLREHTW